MCERIRHMGQSTRAASLGDRGLGASTTDAYVLTVTEAEKCRGADSCFLAVYSHGLLWCMQVEREFAYELSGVSSCKGTNRIRSGP